MALASLVELMQQRRDALVKEVEEADEAIKKINVPEKRNDKPIAAKRARVEETNVPAKLSDIGGPQISSVIGSIRKSTEDEPREQRNGRPRYEEDRAELTKMRNETITKLGTAPERDRNKRLFGVLLAGTLQKFRSEQEQSKQVDVKRKQIEDKIQLRAEREMEEQMVRRSSLVRERKSKLRIARRLERKLKVAGAFDSWSARQLAFCEFIPTRCGETSLSPGTSNDRLTTVHKFTGNSTDQPISNIYYKPRLLNDATQALLDTHRQQIEELVASRKKQLENEIEDLLEQLDGNASRSSATRLVSCIANNTDVTGGAAARQADSESETSDFEGSPSDDELAAFGQSVNVRSVSSIGKRWNV